MTVFEKLKQSNVWDSTHNLPTCPIHNNPWIYMAYSFLILKLNGEERAWKQMTPALGKFYHGCRIHSGLIDRWPDGRGGNTSHDEIMGAGYLIEGFAKEALFHLEYNDGICDNKDDNLGERRNEYRFIFLVPFLEACDGEKTKIKPSLFKQLRWCIHILAHAWSYGRIQKNGTPDLEESGTLKIWLMADIMESFFICRQTYWLWSTIMKKKGNSPKEIFSKRYLTECPWFAESAPDTFT